MSITIFGSDKGDDPNDASLGKSLGEGDRSAKMEGTETMPSLDIMMPDASTGEMREVAAPDVETAQPSNLKADQDLDAGING